MQPSIANVPHLSLRDRDHVVQKHLQGHSSHDPRSFTMLAGADENCSSSTSVAEFSGAAASAIAISVHGVDSNLESQAHSSNVAGEAQTQLPSAGPLLVLSILPLPRPSHFCLCYAAGMGTGTNKGS